MKTAVVLPIDTHRKSIFFLRLGQHRGQNGPTTTNRALKPVQPKKLQKQPSGAYGPRLREKAKLLKFRGNEWLREQIEADAKRYNMTLSNYLQAAMTTFLREGYDLKLYKKETL